MPAKGTKAIRGRDKRKLLHMLVDDEMTQAEMANVIGYTVNMIKTFKARNLDLIEQMRADRDNEFAGLWIANKVERVAAYEEDVEYVQDALPEVAPEDAQGLIRVKQAALRAVAEEMGQLKQHVAVEATTYAVEGVDMKDLD